MGPWPAAPVAEAVYVVCGMLKQAGPLDGEQGDQAGEGCLHDSIEPPRLLWCLKTMSCRSCVTQGAEGAAACLAASKA
jgi:hypothetical protein